MSTLFKQAHALSSPESQLRELNQKALQHIPKFIDVNRDSPFGSLDPTALEIFQVNLGKMCNQTCKHCHVDAGPDRREIMSKDTMQACLDFLRVNIEESKASKSPRITTVDLTGGAPEMNPNFRWFVSELRSLDLKVIVRCNLTIILAGKAYEDLPQFFAEHKVAIVSSLPYFEKSITDRQRGDHVFEKSINALKLLNAVGYGDESKSSALSLDLVYNPHGAYLPAPQSELELQFKQRLWNDYQIKFNHLFTITNMPISRFLEFLVRSGNLAEYMEKLANAYNPAAAASVMCRNTLSVGWDGKVYDCDFNQMLELPSAVSTPDLLASSPSTLSASLKKRKIVVNQHCFGCTAGLGSSCGGTTANS